jgi:hypothetical protein
MTPCASPPRVMSGIIVALEGQAAGTPPASSAATPPYAAHGGRRATFGCQEGPRVWGSVYTDRAIRSSDLSSSAPGAATWAMIGRRSARAASIASLARCASLSLSA